MSLTTTALPERPAMLTMEQALERLLAQARPLEEEESLPLSQGLGRVLSRPVHSTMDVPGWDNSAMDGYAVRAADLAAVGGRLRLSQYIPAGTSGGLLEPGTAARILTGAPVPQGADTVVVQEVCDRDGDWVRFPPEVTAGANIRRAGEDFQAGCQILPEGIRLGAAHLGLAAAAGVAELRVWRRLRVAVLTSGDELVLPGQPLGPGQIYDSNRFTLTGLLANLGCEILDLGMMEDRLEATVETLAEAAERADLVVASGGVSVGDEDHIRPAVERLGTLDLWKVAIRPGKPLVFGHLGPRATPFLGTPGNPVSVFVTFCLFARPFIQRLQGISGDLAPRAFDLPAAFASPRPAKRREFVRARLECAADGRLVVQAHPSRSSGVLSSVVWADGLAVIPEGQSVTPGDLIAFLPMSELGA